jgi:hypothetical protein
MLFQAYVHKKANDLLKRTMPQAQRHELEQVLAIVSRCLA